MLGSKPTPKSGEGAWLWLIKIITGAFIVILILLHFFVNHLLGLEGGLLTFKQVVEYYQNPIIPIIEIAFLIFVISHSLIGLRSIVLDLKPSRSILSIVTWLFTIVGAVAIVYGIWLVTAIVRQGG